MAARKTTKPTKPTTKPKRRSPGRPPHKPTKELRQMVEVLSGYAVPQPRIAAAADVSLPTLMKHYRGELDRGAATVEAKLVGNLLRLASGTDGTALKAIMFSLQTRFGWTQYAPPRRGEGEGEAPAMGKKEQAQRDALNAHEGTGWGDLVH